MHYLNFLCALNYTADEISGLAKKDFTCDSGKSYSINDFNYPSFAVSLPETTDSTLGSGDGFSSSTVKHTRTVTNVGSPGTYKVSISTSDAFKVSVDPEELTFSQTNEKKPYTATFSSVSSEPTDANAFGRIEWTDGKHVVGSPIAVSWT